MPPKPAENFAASFPTAIDSHSEPAYTAASRRAAESKGPPTEQIFDDNDKQSKALAKVV